MLAATVASLVCAPAAGAATYPAGFEETVLVSGLTRPTAVAWAPDGRTFVVEKDGNLKVVAPGDTDATLVKSYAPRVNAHHDRGMLGLAVDSQFASNPYLYLLYTYDLGQLGTPDSSSPMVSQLLRVRIDSSNQVTEETVLLGTYVNGPCPAASNTVDCIPSNGLSHSIGTVRSAPDGTLWVGNGDAASFSTVDPLALRTYDEQSLAGKLMHVDRNGMGLPGHPFCPSNSDLSHNCTKLHAKGFRNPFRFALQPGGGITLGDVGWTSREEIDLIGAGGASYGWPCYEGTIQTPGYRDRTECHAEYAKPPGTHRGPDHDYPHGGSLAVMGGPTYRGVEYPAGFRDSIFFADHSGGFIRRLVSNGSGGWNSLGFATSWAGVSLDEGPDGNLVYTSFGTGGNETGSIRKIVFTPGNATPVPSLVANPTFGPAPLTVAFDAGGSSDPDGDALSYSWDFGDGSPGSSQAAPSHTYTGAGRFTVRLTVTDSRGRSAEAETTVDAANSPPEVTLDGDASYRGGEVFSLNGSATDPQDGPLPPSALEWDVRVLHAGHTHFAGTHTDVAELDVEAITDHDADSHYRVILTATDSNGLTAQRSADVFPETATLSLRSVPSGATVSYGGADYVTPRDLTAAIGFRTSVSAPATLSQGGLLYDFGSWSDGGAQVHNLSVPPGGQTLTATFVERGTGGPPGGGGGEPGTPADRSGPKLDLTAVAPRRGRLRGTALDPSGVRSVDIALRRRAGGGCSWWLAAKRKMAARPRRCDRPRWLSARLTPSAGGARWLVRLGTALPAGGYRVLARASDGAGNLGRLRGELIRVPAR